MNWQSEAHDLGPSENLSRAARVIARVPEATLPSRWSRGQRLKNTLIYRALRAAAKLWQSLPRTWAARLAPLLGSIAMRLARRERRLADLQLRAAFPPWPAAKRQRTVRSMFVNLAESGLELGRLSEWLSGPSAVQIDPEQRAILDAAFAQGRGVIGVTGHIGNWELLAQVIAHAGYPIHTIAKPLYDPRLTRWVHQLRSAEGLGVIWRGVDGGAKDILRVLRQRGMLALLIDQDTDVDGVFVPFFGRPAHTPLAAAALALRFEAPVIVAWLHRTRAKSAPDVKKTGLRETTQHMLHVERLHYMCTGNREADLATLTAHMTARLEEAVRAEPAQWVWLHRRWKRQPLDIT